MIFSFNRRGGEAGIFIMFLALSILTIMGIVIMKFNLDRDGYDYREQEADLLLSEVEDCLTDLGGEGFFAENFDFYTECKINKNVLENGNYLVKISEGERVFHKGFEGLEVECGLKGLEKRKDVAKCSPDDIIIDGKSFKIVVASKQIARRVI
jgi:hypothetical protein